MTVFGILWLLGFGIGCVIVSVMSRREARNLSWLALFFAMNAAVFGLIMPFLHALGGHTFLAVALVDLIMALLCIVFWCFASRWIAGISLLLMAINLATFAWYSHPVPRETFLIAYEFHPYLVRVLEALQLSVMIYFTPAIYRLARRPPKETREPPCHRLTAAR